MKVLLRRLQRFGDLLNCMVSAHKTEASFNATERLYMDPLIDYWPVPFFLHSLWSSFVVVLTMCAPMKPDTGKCSIDRAKLVCTLHIQYESKHIVLRWMWCDGADWKLYFRKSESQKSLRGSGRHDETVFKGFQAPKSGVPKIRCNRLWYVAGICFHAYACLSVWPQQGELKESTRTWRTPNEHRTGIVNKTEWLHQIKDRQMFACYRCRQVTGHISSASREILRLKSSLYATLCCFEGVSDDKWTCSGDAGIFRDCASHGYSRFVQLLSPNLDICVYGW